MERKYQLVINKKGNDTEWSPEKGNLHITEGRRGNESVTATEYFIRGGVRQGGWEQKGKEGFNGPSQIQAKPKQKKKKNRKTNKVEHKEGGWVGSP